VIRAQRFELRTHTRLRDLIKRLRALGIAELAVGVVGLVSFTLRGVEFGDELLCGLILLMIARALATLETETTERLTSAQLQPDSLRDCQDYSPRNPKGFTRR
jgi:uncharacterized membrane protein